MQLQREFCWRSIFSRHGFRRAVCRLGVVLAVSFLLPPRNNAVASTLPLSQQMANATLQKWPLGHYTTDQTQWKWDYELGTVLEGMDDVWYNTANHAYYRYIQQSVDALLGPDGSIPTYHIQDESLDAILLGRQLLLLYRVTQDKKYYRAAALLRRQLAEQPRNASGGFWHKKEYPNQMWLDGLYMAEPFYAEYASVFHEPQDFADITHQFALVDEHARDAKTGLLYHAWDAAKQQAWASKTTGDSPNFWGRATGWYMMALVDTLPYYKAGDPGRETLLAILSRTAAAVAKVQDPQTGLWYQVLDKPGAKGNYLESSAAEMFVYAFAKGVRLGYLPPSYALNASRGYRGILQHFVQNDQEGTLTICCTVHGTGLGGHPYSYGTYAYYVSVPVFSGDPRGVGAFLMASSEMELTPHVDAGRGDTVLMDSWFNSQQRDNAAGKKEFFHYKWNDFSNSGFSLLGHVFRTYGANTATLYRAPSAAALKQAQIYMIVSPDVPARNPHPHFMTARDADQVAAWVRQGGVLVLMENDPANADIAHFNLLADKFGVHFNSVLVNHVVDKDIGHGRLAVSGAGPMLPGSHIFYMKDTCTITVGGDARALVQSHGNTMMATARYGKGTVLAVVDPWVYNEYTDGHNDNLPPEYDNFSGARAMARWLLQQIPNPAEAR